MATAVSDPGMAALLCGARRAARTWPGLRVEYSWLPPFEGESVTQPNRLEVVFSRHDRVELSQDGRAHRLRAEAGACYVVGAEPTVLRRVGEYSDTLVDAGTAAPAGAAAGGAARPPHPRPGRRGGRGRARRDADPRRSRRRRRPQPLPLRPRLPRGDRARAASVRARPSYRARQAPGSNHPRAGAGDRLDRGLREPEPLPAPVRGAARRAAGGAAPGDRLGRLTGPSARHKGRAGEEARAWR